MSSPNIPERLVLEGVPQVHFYQGGKRCPEDLCFASCMRAWLAYRGESEYGCKHSACDNTSCVTACTYAYMIGISGTALWLTWKPGYSAENAEFRLMSDDPEAPIRRTCESLGYAYTYLSAAQLADKARALQMVADSLQHGLPVISFGLVGPPEAGLITGLDEHGDIAIGWSFFQADPEFSEGLQFEPNGYYRKRDWLQSCSGLLVMGDKQERKPIGTIYRQALNWCVQVARAPQVHTNGAIYHNGLTAYTAWAEHLLDDSAFPAHDETVLRQHHWIHEMAIGLVAEARWYGSQFLAEMTDRVDVDIHRSAIEDIYHSAAYLAGIHDLMWQLWDLEGGNGNPDAFRRMADPVVRAKSAQVILESQAKEARAVEHIEHCLSFSV